MNDPPIRSESISWLSVALITAVAAALRIRNAAGQSLWSDEIGSMIVATKPLQKLLGTVILDDVNPPLFYLVLHVWRLLGSGEGVLRLLPILCGVATVPIVYLLARRLFDRSTGLVAAVLLAASPLHVYYSQELRSISALALIASIFFLLLTAETVGRNRRAALIAVTFLGCFVHYGFFLVAASGVVFLLEKRRAKAYFARPAKAIVAGLVLASPFAALAAFQIFRGNTAIKGLSPGFGLFELLREVPIYLTYGQSPKRPPTFGVLEGLISGGKPGFLYGALLVLALPFLILVIRGAMRCIKEGPRRAMLFYWLGFPLAVLAVVAIYVPYLEPKYLVAVLPPFLIFAAAGVTARWKQNRWIGPALLGFVLVACAISIVQYQSDRRYQRDDWRGLITYIESRERSGDALVNFSFEASYYFGGEAFIAPAVPIPYREWLQQGFQVDEHQWVAQARQVLEKNDRFWIRQNRYGPLRWLDQMIGRIEESTFEVTPADMPDFEIPVQLRTKDRNEYVAYLTEHLPSELNFAEPKAIPGQLHGEWPQGENGWVWTTNESSVLLAVPENAGGVEAEIYLNLELLGADSTKISLEIDGEICSSIKATQSEQYLLHCPVEGEKSHVRVAIHSDHGLLIDKDSRLRRGTPRTLLVRTIGVQIAP
jgi:Dolichyl-phosphate-mannose-protein mannosyltransferase